MLSLIQSSVVSIFKQISSGNLSIFELGNYINPQRFLDWVQKTDWTVLDWIQANIRCGFLDYVMPKITMLGNAGIIWILIAVIMLCIKKYRKCGILILAGLFTGLLIGNLGLKPLIARARPCWLDPSFQLLVPIPKDFSFPSGHTLASVIAASILVLNNKKSAFWAIPLALAIAFSRMYLYLHFPSDVFTSICLGIPIALVVNRFMPEIITIAGNYFKKKLKSHQGNQHETPKDV